MICKNYARRTLADIVRHIRDVYPHFEGPLRCGVDNCPSTVSTYKSLRQHMYDKHKNAMKVADDHVLEGTVANDELEENATTDDIMAAEGGGDLHTDSEMSSCSHANPPLIDDQTAGDQPINCEAAKFILKILEGRKLTQTTTADIIGDTTIFIERALDNVKQKLRVKLGDLSKEVEAIFSLPEICNPFQGLETKYQQEKFFQHHFNYVVSCNVHDGIQPHALNVYMCVTCVAIYMLSLHVQVP